LNRALYIISYDVGDNRRRRLLSRVLEGSARRVQKSVFETCASAGDMLGIISACERFIQIHENDSLRIYKVTEDSNGCLVNIGGPVFDWRADIIL